MTSVGPLQCVLCRHWVSPFDRDDDNANLSDGDGLVQVCAAFPLPDGIPARVWTNQVDHRQPVDGDGGVRWEPDSPDTVHPADQAD
jgi:hypothetical protein